MAAKSDMHDPKSLYLLQKIYLRADAQTKLGNRGFSSTTRSFDPNEGPKVVIGSYDMKPRILLPCATLATFVLYLNGRKKGCWDLVSGGSIITINKTSIGVAARILCLKVSSRIACNNFRSLSNFTNNTSKFNPFHNTKVYCS
jgi:hypothetical protein